SANPHLLHLDAKRLRFFLHLLFSSTTRTLTFGADDAESVTAAYLHAILDGSRGILKRFALYKRLRYLLPHLLDELCCVILVTLNEADAVIGIFNRFTNLRLVEH